jgi:hypothetical protein
VGIRTEAGVPHCPYGYGRKMRAFWIDEDYDRDNASNRRSRYAAYVLDRREALTDAWTYFEDPQIRSSDFAGSAWRVATGPIMAPGYVRYHGRVLSAGVVRSGWDGSLLGDVELVTPWPAELTRSRGWQGEARWQDWDTEQNYGADDDTDPFRYGTPYEHDAVKRPYLLCRSALSFPLPAEALPKLPDAAPDGDALVDLARRYVGELVYRMNAVVAPIIETLEKA